MGAATWSWHRTGDPQQIAECASGRTWLALPCAASAGKARLALLGMENVGGQPARPLLSAHSKWKASTDPRAVQVETAGARRSPHHETGERVNPCGGTFPRHIGKPLMQISMRSCEPTSRLRPNN